MTRGNRISVYWGEPEAICAFPSAIWRHAKMLHLRSIFFLSLLRNEAEGRTQT